MPGRGKMIEKGSFKTEHGNLQKLRRWLSAPLDEMYNKAWLNIQEDKVNGVANMGKSVVSYCTYTEPFVEEMNVHESVGENGMQTLVNLDDLENYVEFVGGDEVTVSFFGNENEKLCRKMEIDGDLTVTIYVPHSEGDYNSIQTKIINVYDEDDRWCKPNSGEYMSTRFKTDVDQFERIIKVTDFDDFALSTYPIVVEDGKFVLNASDDRERNSVAGELEAEVIEEVDVNNHYTRGFSELFENISGEVEVDVEQDHPISIVRKSEDGAVTLRYTLLTAKKK